MQNHHKPVTKPHNQIPPPILKHPKATLTPPKPNPKPTSLPKKANPQHPNSSLRNSPLNTPHKSHPRNPYHQPIIGSQCPDHPTIQSNNLTVRPPSNASAIIIKQSTRKTRSLLPKCSCYWKAKLRQCPQPTSKPKNSKSVNPHCPATFLSHANKIASSIYNLPNLTPNTKSTLYFTPTPPKVSHNDHPTNL